MKKTIIGILALPLMLFWTTVALGEFGGTITKSFEQPVLPSHIEVVYDKTNPDSMLTNSNPAVMDTYRTVLNTIITSVLQIVDWNSSDGALTFTGTQYSINNGCNTLFGTYVIHGTQIKLSTPASTMMACETELMDADQKLAEKLQIVEHIGFQGGALVLSGNNTQLEFSPSF